MDKEKKDDSREMTQMFDDERKKLKYRNKSK